MKIKEYLVESERTESNIFEPYILNPKTIHGCFGLAGESGELLDAIKKVIFYGQKPDFRNIREEIGDVMWYVAMICRSLDWDLSEILNENIEKLSARYPEKFTTEKSIERLDKINIEIREEA